MPVDAFAAIAPLGRLPSVAGPQPTDAAAPGAAGGGFAGVLNHLLADNRQATATADRAIQSLATGQAQDLHEVSLAVTQSELSFRLILELRNRLADAFQEVTRMQV